MAGHGSCRRSSPTVLAKRCARWGAPDRRHPWLALLPFAFCLAFAGEAFAQYRPPPRQEEAREARATDRFEEAVSLSRFRRGNPDWDTQELIAAGLTALHEEHLKILEELESLKAEIARLKEKK